ncbi:hypothetical protein NIES4071_101350 (plasmid) [Calothrix sp. NIES-4071]|nr:hypothetical protein NIES4071_101350 [Calothrix sp. NIES-4071]BAZ64516.1 hypothetical protein NIES4105_102490 [Calothrix sp. NIES-4105]
MFVFLAVHSKEKSLRTRLQKTLNALELLKKPRRGKKKLTSVEQWEASIAAILKRYRTNTLRSPHYLFSTTIIQMPKLFALLCIGSSTCTHYNTHIYMYNLLLLVLVSILDYRKHLLHHIHKN